jgi:hypothetical protein
MQTVLFPLEKSHFGLQLQVFLSNFVKTGFKLQILMIKLLLIVLDLLWQKTREIGGDADCAEHVALASPLDEMSRLV